MVPDLLRVQGLPSIIKPNTANLHDCNCIGQTLVLFLKCMYTLTHVPPGTCSIKILMYPSSETEPRYWTMFLCLRYLCRAISSCSGCEYLHTLRSSANHTERHHNSDHTEAPFSPAVPLGDLLNGDAHLVAQVSPSIHHSVRAPPEHHPVPVLIVVVLVLKHTWSSRHVLLHSATQVNSDWSGLVSKSRLIGPQHLLSLIIQICHFPANERLTSSVSPSPSPSSSTAFPEPSEISSFTMEQNLQNVLHSSISNITFTYRQFQASSVTVF